MYAPTMADEGLRRLWKRGGPLPEAGGSASPSGGVRFFFRKTLFPKRGHKYEGTPRKNVKALYIHQYSRFRPPLNPKNKVCSKLRPRCGATGLCQNLPGLSRPLRCPSCRCFCRGRCRG